MGDTNQEEPTKIKVTAVGDCGVGKTCMLMTYVNNKFPEDENEKTLYKNNDTIKAGRSTSFEVSVTVNSHGSKFVLGLTDTIGSDEYRRIRELFTAETDIFLVCFSVTDPETLDNVKLNWLSEIKILAPKASFILVGTKTDLREEEDVLKKLKERDLKAISIQEGIKTAKSVGAKMYVECSALNQIGLKEVFDTVVGVTVKNNPGIKDKKDKDARPGCTVS